MLLVVSLALLVLVVAILGIAAARPGSIHVERSTSIMAPAEKIYPLINDFREWAAWSPYEARDPAMRKDYSGASSGKGAIYAWDGNGQVGQGRMEITDTVSPSRVTIALDFVRPFKGHNVAAFTLLPEGARTRVTWMMDGPLAYPAKVIGIFMNMDTMIGRDFETGLARLKGIAEP
jgi:hypothetical protein